MKIVNIIGGLGNQMFQYAFAVALKQKFPDEEIRIYTRSFNGYKLHNGYELPNLFNITLKYATTRDVIRVYWPVFHYKLWQIARHCLPSRKCIKEKPGYIINEYELENGKFFDGYFQRVSYLFSSRKEIQQIFSFPNIEDDYNLSAVKFIQEDESASIHVRRGDYLDHPVYGGICTTEYYMNALSVLKKKTATKRLLIFSNDIFWCKTVLADLLRGFKVMYVDWNNGKSSFRDMQLMSLCDHNIIANSSFSWWGAWLNRNKNQLVIAPKKWDNNEKFDNMYLDSWIVV